MANQLPKCIMIFVVCFSMINGEKMPSIRAANYNDQTKSIDIDIQYGGGCKEHKFELKIGACLESFPVQCGAKLIDLVEDDLCEALLLHRVSFGIETLGLNTNYYSGATIRIKGDENTTATVILPV
ncbi:hypothetical protein I4U23_022606 [Adineta vaga]|nr:hypothetical protein I4U23_022606 [Adineta vaga]